jgi:hypothetical protein
MNTYPLTQTNKNQEFAIIKEILKNNGYQHSNTHYKSKNKTQEYHPQTQKKETQVDNMYILWF